MRHWPIRQVPNWPVPGLLSPPPWRSNTTHREPAADPELSAAVTRGRHRAGRHPGSGRPLAVVVLVTEGRSVHYVLLYHLANTYCVHYGYGERWECRLVQVGQSG